MLTKDSVFVVFTQYAAIIILVIGEIPQDFAKRCLVIAFV